MPQVGSFEMPFLPSGYTPQQVAAAGSRYAQSRGYRGPHMVMMEGAVEERDGIPGIHIKYVDGQGLTTTEWTPLKWEGQQAAPAPAAPRGDLSGDVVPPEQFPSAGGDPNRVPDAQNPRAVAYALQRLAQLRALGYEFDIVEGDPTATWRNASIGIAEAARAAGYENPRDWLAGRQKPAPRPAAGFFDEGDTVAPPRAAPRTQRSHAKAAQKLVKRPAVKSKVSGAKKVIRPADIEAAAKRPRGPYRPPARTKITRRDLARAQPYKRGR